MTLLIFIIFGLLIGHKSISVQVKGVTDDWPQKRCNPLFMPFADDPIGNFTFCIQKTQREFMDELLMPINNSLSVFGKTISGVLDSMNFIRKLLDFMRNSIITVISNIYAIFLNIIIEFQRSTIAIKDMIGKLMGVMVSLIYMVDGSVKTAESTWNGPPGKLIRGLCFDKHTLLQRNNGTFETIEKIEPGSILKDGTEIVGKVILNNLNKDGSFREEFMRFPKQGEKNESIYVTPYHFILMEDGSWNYVKNHNKAIKTNYQTEKLYCLITNNRTIPIGNLIFHDWEDNEDMHKNINNI
jgi:hypothetical protein